MLKPLDTITTVQDMLDYVTAEANEAATQCPAARQDYLDVIQWLQDSNPGVDASSFSPLTQIDTGTPFGDSEASVVETARNMVYQARKAWYAAGCPKPGTVTPAASTSNIESVSWESLGIKPKGDSGFGTGFLLLAGGLLAVMLFTSKKKGGKRRAKRTSRRRRRR